MIGKEQTPSANNSNGLKGMIIENEIFNWFPLASNDTNLAQLGDVANGRIGNTYYQLSYAIGDQSQLSSWTILNQEQLY